MHRTRVPRAFVPCVLLVVAATTMQPSTVRAAKSVVTTLPSFTSIVHEIGADRVEVSSLCRGYEDPHYIQPKPSYARTLRNAMLLIYNGLELEVGWLPALLETARNPSLSPGAPGLLEVASAVENVLEVPTGELSRAQGDIHPFGNPHVMLDPRNALAATDLIAERLAELDPDGAQVYRDAATAYRQRLQTKITEWETLAAPLRDRPVVAYHKQWEYLAHWLGLNIVDYIESKAGIPPAPRHVTAVIEKIREQGVTLVIAATFVDEGAASKVAKSGGARLAVLPAEVGGVDGTDSYIELIETIVRELVGE